MGYPALLALIYRVSDHPYAWVTLLHAVLGGFTVVLMHRMATRLFAGGSLPVLAATLIVVHPPFVFYSGLLMTETVATFAVLAVSRLLLRARERPVPSRWILAGLLFGFATVVCPNFLVVLPLVASWLTCAGDCPTRG